MPEEKESKATCDCCSKELFEGDTYWGNNQIGTYCEECAEKDIGGGGGWGDMNIFIDLDGVVIDFYKAAKQFGIALEFDDFNTWHWNCGTCCKYPTPEEFYSIAELQRWFTSLIMKFASGKNISFITKDHLSIKRKLILRSIELLRGYCESRRWLEAADKSIHCTGKHDILIDDNPHECKAWRAKGGTAFHFNLSKPDIFAEFQNWWRLENAN